jgi:riboflavin biosynthesis pyrimidine reductase
MNPFDDPASQGPAYRLIELPAAPPDRPYVLVNMVMSADGRTVIEDTERGLGSATDQRLMRELRSLVDVVLNGANTLRASGSSSRLNDPSLEGRREARGRPPVPTAAVITESADLPLDRAFFTARDFPAVVYVGATAPDTRVAAIAATGRPVHRLPAEAPLRWLLAHARRELDAQALLVEGGSALNGALFDAGLVDEYFLTLAPRVVGGRDTLPAVRSDRAPSIDAVTQLALISATPNAASGELYLRYRVRRAGDA